MASRREDFLRGGRRVMPEPLKECSLPRDLPLFRHQLPQCPIDSRLVTSSLPFEPCQNVGIQTQRHCLLDRPVVSQPLRHRSRRTLSPARGSRHPANLPAPTRLRCFTCKQYMYIVVRTILPRQNVPRGTYLHFCKPGWRPPNLLEPNQPLHQLRVVFLL